MKNSEITIVIVAFNRPHSLERLLKSLEKVSYPRDEHVRLYISIDRAVGNNKDNLKVKEVAEKFNWKFGEKIVDFKTENLGLKEHVLSCGNLTNIYENIIVLEDDIIVSPHMYSYANQVLEKYRDDNRIAGFGLYSFQRNQLNNMPFYPIEDGSDVFFMKYACSWGQMWTKKKWNEFKEWYDKCEKDKFDCCELPNYVGTWKEQSWLKYHIRYVVEKNKFFVYPRVGLTSNFTDVGVHNKERNFGYQCCMYSIGKEKRFDFIELDDSYAIYDAYYENLRMNKILHKNKNIICDFFGEKELKNIKETDLLLSTRKYNYKIIDSYALEMYPYEQNIINDIKGNDLMLYDLSKKRKNILKIREDILVRYSYKIDNLRNIDIKILMKYFINKIFKKVLKKIMRK